MTKCKHYKYTTARSHKIEVRAGIHCRSTAQRLLPIHAKNSAHKHSKDFNLFSSVNTDSYISYPKAQSSSDSKLHFLSLML